MSQNTSEITCHHHEVYCLNPYDLIRKYTCLSCFEVMMCSCDEAFGVAYLPHQLATATDLLTKSEIAVSLGFQPGICRECRGLQPEAFPTAAIHGRTSKVRRYYWREIAFETIKRFAALAESKGLSSWQTGLLNSEDEYKRIEMEVAQEIEKLHEVSPKYIYLPEISQDEAEKKWEEERIEFHANYSRERRGRKRLLLYRNDLVSAEEYASQQLAERGYDVTFTESVPFHVLFGVFTWILIQSPEDLRNRLVYFQDRRGLDDPSYQELIGTLLPEDFGTSYYALRRAQDIHNHFAKILWKTHELIWLFDLWIEPSFNFRQYLWAHRQEDVETGKTLLSILPPEHLKRILKYMIGGYWERYLGWPDMIAANNQEYFFAEVKSSKDKLSADQKSWLKGNHEEMHLPFRLIKIHKSSES